MGYEDYLKRNNFSENTRYAYLKDLEIFEEYLNGKKLNETDRSDIIRYIIDLRENNYSESSIARKVAALKSYFYFAINMGLVPRDPTFEVDSPKLNKNKDIKTLTDIEVNDLINKPMELYGEKIKGLRDMLLFTLIYETGINISDILNIKISDVNIEIGYLNYKNEYLKLSEVVLNLNKKYFKLINEKYPKNNYLFINMNGEQLTRQGLWKVFNFYSKKLNFEKNISPQVLLNTHYSKYNRR